MNQFKQFVSKHFEKILIIIILMATFVGTYFVEERSIVLNFYFLPVLSAGYFLGRRMGVLTAIFSILVVVISTFFFPQTFPKGQDSFQCPCAVVILGWIPYPGKYCRWNTL